MTPVQKLKIKDWSQLRVVLDWAYEGEVLPGNLKQDRYASGQSAYLIRKGKLLVRTEKGSVEAGPGKWIFPREGVRLLLFEPGTELLSIRFHLSWPGEYSIFSWDIAMCWDSREAPELEKHAVELIRLITGRYTDPRTHLQRVRIDFSEHLQIQRQFLDWLALYIKELEARHVTPTRLGQIDTRALDAGRILDRFPWNQPFREGDLAQAVNLSVSQVNRIFRKHYGCTPREYRESRRLELAVSRLQVTTDGIKEIAYDLGFYSPSHFSVWLRRKIRCSPSQLREKFQGK